MGPTLGLFSVIFSQIYVSFGLFLLTFRPVHLLSFPITSGLLPVTQMLFSNHFGYISGHPNCFLVTSSHLRWVTVHFLSLPVRCYHFRLIFGQFWSLSLFCLCLGTSSYTLVTSSQFSVSCVQLDTWSTFLIIHFLSLSICFLPHLLHFKSLLVYSFSNYFR